MERTPNERHSLTRSIVAAVAAPLAIFLLAALLIYTVQTFVLSREWLSPANANVASLIIFVLALIALGTWLWGWAPFPQKVRRTLVGVEVAIIVLLLIFLRIDGVTGNLQPRLVFRWQARQHQLLQEETHELPPDAGIPLTRGQHDWPQYLGPSRTATVEGPHIARDWAASPPTIRWHRPIGAAWSSWAIVGGYCFTQEQRGNSELTTCYDMHDGALQWAHAEEAYFSERLSGDGPRATPTVHEGNVYAMGATGILICLNGRTGQLRWRHDVLSEAGAELPMYGIAVSPLIVDDQVVVSIGGPSGNSVLSYDKLTGEKRWSVGSEHVSYCSPTLMTIADVQQIVVIHAESISGHAPESGEVLWTIEWPGAGDQPHSSQPIDLGDGRLLISKAYGIGTMVFQVTRNEGGQGSVDAIWNERVMRTKFNTPVLHDGYVYGLDEGYLQCIDPSDGRRIWKKHRSQNYGHGQLLLVGDLLLVQSEDPGDLVLVEPNPQELRELGRLRVLEGKSWNHMAISGKLLLMRNATQAACIELPIQ